MHEFLYLLMEEIATNDSLFSGKEDCSTTQDPSSRGGGRGQGHGRGQSHGCSNSPTRRRLGALFAEERYHLSKIKLSKDHLRNDIHVF